MTAGVVPPGESHYLGVQTIAASSWVDSNGAIDIGFNLSEVSSGKPGVYTIIVWLDNKAGIHGRLNSDPFDATAWSIVVD
jgi:hypothetical protein